MLSYMIFGGVKEQITVGNVAWISQILDPWEVTSEPLMRV